MCMGMSTQSQYKVYFTLYVEVKHFEKYWSKGSDVTFRVKCLKYFYTDMKI